MENTLSISPLDLGFELGVFAADEAFVSAMTQLQQLDSLATAFVRTGCTPATDADLASPMDNLFVGKDGGGDSEASKEFDSVFGELALFPTQLDGSMDTCPTQLSEVAESIAGSGLNVECCDVSVLMDNCAWPCTTANTMTNIFKPFRPWEEAPSITTVSLPPSPSSLSPSSDITADPQPKQPQPSKSKTRRTKSTPLSKTAKKIHICSFDGCGKEFDRAFNLRTHEKIHAKDRTRDHVCRYCDAGFYGVHALSRHIASHDQIRRQQCGACGRGFARVDALRRHEKICGI